MPTPPEREPQTNDASPYRSAFRNACRSAAATYSLIEEQRFVASQRFAALCEQTPERRLLLVRNDPRYRSWPLLDLLVRTWMPAPDEGEGVESFENKPWLSLALEILVGLEQEEPVAEAGDFLALAWDLRARLHAWAGSSRMGGGDWWGAAEAFAAAEHCLELGSGDPLDHACVESLKVSWHFARAHPEAARAGLYRLLSIYFLTGEEESMTRTALRLAARLCSVGEGAEAVRLLRTTERRLEVGVAPSLRIDLLRAEAEVMRVAGRLSWVWTLEARIRRLTRPALRSQEACRGRNSSRPDGAARRGPTPLLTSGPPTGDSVQ